MTRRPAVLAPLLTLSLAAFGAQSPIEIEELPAPAEESADEAPATPRSAATAASEDEAVRRYAEGDLEGAREVYDRLTAAPGDDRERARFALHASWLAWQLGDRAGAMKRLEAAVYLDPDVEFRGDLYSPEFVAAFYDARRVALHRRKVTSSNAINAAVAQLRSGQLGRARELLHEALQLVPDDPDAVYNLALVDLRDGDTDAALAGFERVLALERGNPEGVTRELKVQALNNAAVVYFSRGDYLDAETALAEAVRLVPEDASAWFNLGLTRQKLGRTEPAHAALLRARGLAPADVPIARALALAEIERGNWMAAAALLVEATAAEPADADLHLLLGRAQRGLGDAAGAATSFRRALELDADGGDGVAVPAARLLAETQRSAGDPAGSAAAARELLARLPEDPEGWMYVGLAALATHDLPAAIEALERARRAAPERADIAHNLGSAYVAALDYARAEETLRAALELDPDNAATRAALAQLEARSAAPPGSRLELGARFSVGDYPELGLRGLRVDAVAADSPASRAGLRPGDLVLRVAGRPVTDAADLARRIGERRGSTAVSILREGRTLELKIRLE
jgi:tetratricopeptide (TPR) repeat protein